MMGSGAVGEDVDILLRGSRSINGSNAPLLLLMECKELIITN